MSGEIWSRYFYDIFRFFRIVVCAKTPIYIRLEYCRSLWPVNQELILGCRTLLPLLLGFLKKKNNVFDLLFQAWICLVQVICRGIKQGYINSPEPESQIHDLQVSYIICRGIKQGYVNSPEPESQIHDLQVSYIICRDFKQGYINSPEPESQIHDLQVSYKICQGIKQVYKTLQNLNLRFMIYRSVI